MKVFPACMWHDNHDNCPHGLMDERRAEILVCECSCHGLDKDPQKCRHVQDQIDYDGTERAHCAYCGRWYVVETGEIE